MAKAAPARANLTKRKIAASLTIETPGAPNKVVSLDKQRYQLGRSSSNDLSFPADPLLSREHLVFERKGDAWMVRDLASQNGTRVNGTTVHAGAALFDGDRIQAGHLVVTYKNPDDELKPSRVTFVGGNKAGSNPAVTVLLQSALEARVDRPAQQASHLRALTRAGRELAGLGVVDNLYEITLDLSLESVDASRGVIMTADASGNLQVRANRGDHFEISTTVRDLVMKQAKSLLVRDALGDSDFAAHTSIVAQEVRSILAVPLQTDERVMGLLYLDSPHVVREYNADDLNLVTVIANIAAIRMEHAKLVEKEQTRQLIDQDLERAADIQRRLLPGELPKIEGFDCAGYNAPCRSVGGDYYDCLPYADGRVAVVIGDVSGKGMGAALLMASLQARAQAIFGEKGSVAEEVGRLNKSISANCPGNSFITFFAGVLHPETGELTYCNAGHNPPLLLRAGGRTEQLTATGVPLGISRDAVYEQGNCCMETGDVLALFSDGITEACDTTSDQEFGEERLIAALRRTNQMPAARAVDAIRQEVLAFAKGIAADDMTLVIARRRVTP